MRPLYLALFLAFACGGSPPHVAVTRPAELAIWPGEPPDGVTATAPESSAPGGSLVAGQPWTELSDVSTPTMTVYPPAGASTGAAVVVFPGGGYKHLAIDLEGTEICDWLTSIGVTCVLLKYRVPFTGPYGEPDCGCHIMPDVPRALQDAQRTLSLVRHRAAEWGLDPHRIGVLGTSAGGHLVAATSTRFADRAYAPVDDADAESCRPDFAIALYPGHLWNQDDDIFELEPDVTVTADTPPTFLLQAEDDEVDPPNHALVYYRALIAAGVPVEMHLYAEGGHAFGLRETAAPITRWPALVETWLGTLGVTRR